MTDLIYLSSTTSICHIGEKGVKSTTYLLYLSHRPSICCIRLLVVKGTCALNLGIRYSRKLYLLQQKYLQCRADFVTAFYQNFIAVPNVFFLPKVIIKEFSFFFLSKAFQTLCLKYLPGT